jgi:V-type H+-transporting ATPase subunit H
MSSVDFDGMPEARVVLLNKENWQGMATGGLITERQHALLERYDGQPREAKQVLLMDEGDEYAEMFVHLLAKLSTPHTVRHVMALVVEMLEFDNQNVDLMLRLHRVDAEELPLAPLFVLGEHQDRWISWQANKVLALLLSRASWAIDELSVRRIVHWFSSVVHDDCNAELLQFALGALQILLRKDAFRRVFSAEDGVNMLSSLLGEHTRSKNFQVVYQTIYCFWLLSYNAHLAEHEFHRTTAIERIVAAVKGTTSDKVVRVGVAALRNLIDRASNNDLIIEAGFMRVLAALLHRKWGDDDLAEDLEALDQSLQKNMLRMSSFDAYRAELFSGELSWSPVHKSERFWRENATRFEEDTCRVLGVLIELILNSDNDVALSVALHDLGEFARFHPRGRQIINQFPAVKARLLELINIESSSKDKADVQSRALLTCQKIMIQNWEFISSTTGNNGATAQSSSS